MKLTTARLKKLIREEIENTMKESRPDVLSDSQKDEYKKDLEENPLTVDEVFEKFETGPQNPKFVKRYVDELALASKQDPKQYKNLIESEEWMQVVMKLRGKFNGHLYSIDWKTGKVQG